MSDPGSGHPLSAKVATTVETKEMAILWAKAKRAELENQISATQIEIKALKLVKLRGLEARLLVLEQQIENLNKIEKDDIPKISYKQK